MADTSDVENALCDMIVAALYPAGTAAPSAVSAPCRVDRGWPIAAQLESELAEGRANISVFPRPTEMQATRYPREWKTLVPPVHTITAVVAGRVVTIGGTVGAGQYVTLRAARAPAVSYQAKAGDTPATIAAALAALVPGAAAAGPAITWPDGRIVTANVGAPGTSWRELKRQERHYQITLWCPTPALRDAIARVVDPALSRDDRIALPNGEIGHLRYVSSATFDDAQKAGEYRRDLIYKVEFPTSETATHYEITSHEAFVTSN